MNSAAYGCCRIHSAVALSHVRLPSQPLERVCFGFDLTHDSVEGVGSVAEDAAGVADPADTDRRGLLQRERAAAPRVDVPPTHRLHELRQHRFVTQEDGIDAVGAGVFVEAGAAQALCELLIRRALLVDE